MHHALFATERTLTISDLNRLVRERLETTFPLIWVQGEISNLSRATSGHLYFTLKDDQAQARCVVWRNKAQLLGWLPENGQQVDVRALVTLYEPRGDYQLNVETVRRTGQGALFQRFLELKTRLEAEGLFDPAGKRPLPAFPRRIGIVTSPQAAALQDVLTTLRRRAPHIALSLYPTPVQGSDAAARIAQALARAGQDGNDLLLLCRGGGSLEDLWAFNEEAVARALRASPVPVVCGIGHETDFTIAEFAADQRAPTPTAAAEMASPERDALRAGLDHLDQRLSAAALRCLMNYGQRLDHLTARLIHPRQRLLQQNETLDRLHVRLSAALTQRCAQQAHLLQHLGLRLGHAGKTALNLPAKRLESLATSLRQLDPFAVLARGYAVVRSEDGQIIRDAAQLSPGQQIDLTLAHGRSKATVTP
ncbi:MAG: Exodeoxyribonuclease 7 large subunit [Betaproteobacteria bacterium ADurb.Bin341]|nr:MAG: Exodeoxyribonuclease 7 large subunit [Betaproteobacteria bacterium ADurb.Bin341]